MNETEVAQRLRETLGTLADGVRPSPDAYERALHEWRRRERRRRLIAVVLAVVVIAGADALGVWALNGSASHSPVLFNAPPPMGVPGP